MTVEVRVLGPVGLAALDPADPARETAPPSLGRAQRRLLARLCVVAGTVVSTERLAHDLDLASEGAVRTTVSRLRQVVGDVVVREPPGYYVQAEMVDTYRFGTTLTAARAAEPVEAIPLYDAALGLWHGTALVEFADEEWARAESIRLDELHHTAQEERVQALIATGRFDDATADAERLVREQPLRERRRAQLMRSLNHQGRRTEALRAYQEYRDYLADEIGVDPSRELIDLEAQIVAGTVLTSSDNPATDVDQSHGGPTSAQPTGQVTFLFTDVEGSSALWEQDADAMNAALEEHDRRIRQVVAEYDGYVFTTAGDSFSVAFSAPANAVWAAIGIQHALAVPSAGLEIRVRIGLHTGESTERDGDYFGPVLNRCARLMSAGHGGQILLSEATVGLIRDLLEAELDVADLGKHELKDLSRPEHIYQVSEPSLLREFPPLRTPNVVETKLPIQLTSFVGRERELGEVAELLSTARLVTLAGTGGGGKTRLALEAVDAAADTYAGGVGFVELASITDPDLVADTTAAVFDVVPVPDHPIEAAIAAKIGDRDVLLLIDHCGHVVDAVATMIRELLRLAPGLRVLVTSQAPLGIAGETVYRVPTLSVPDEASDSASALSNDAVALFSERATLANPSFLVTEENVDAVVSLCRRLDGIPLALELAAARIKILGPEAIVERLDQRFRLLAGASQSEDRHQSLQATIDWSHDLLPDSEKAVFRRCAVFGGSFSLTAVEAIATDNEIDEFAVLDLFSALVDKSLIVVDEAGDRTRFRFLESMRHYALGQLGESADATSAPHRHLAYFAEYAESLLHQLRGGELTQALAGMRAERDNFRVALEYGLCNEHHELAARIIGGVGHLWYLSGAFREGIDWCVRLMALEPDLSPTVMASVLHSYGSLLGSWAEPEAGASMLERQVVLRRELDEPLRLAAALNNLGSIWTEIGRRDEGEAALREAVEIYQAEQVSPVLPIIGLGWSNLHAGDYEQANDYYHDALVQARAENDDYDLALTTTSMGICAAHLGRLEDARSLLEEGHGRFSQLGVVPGRQDAELHLAVVDRAEGQSRDAANHLVAALEEPDSHWTASGKFWVVQIATSIIEDRALASQLIGFVTQYYQGVNEAQPTFVRDDLETTTAQLVDELGAEFRTHSETAQQRSPAEVISLTRAALLEIVGT